MIIRLIKESLKQILKVKEVTLLVLFILLGFNIVNILTTMIKNFWVAPVILLLSTAVVYWQVRYSISCSQKDGSSIKKIFPGSLGEFIKFLLIQILIMVIVMVSVFVCILLNVLPIALHLKYWLIATIPVSVLIILAMIYYLLRITFAFYILIDKKCGIGAALSKSLKLTNKKMKTILAFIFQNILVFSPLIVFQIIVQQYGIAANPLIIVIYSILMAVFSLVIGVVYVNFYRELGN